MPIQVQHLVLQEEAQDAIFGGQALLFEDMEHERGRYAIQ